MANLKGEELQKLFNDLKENKKSSFEILYNKYRKLVYGISYSILKNNEEAEDSTQAVFTKLFQLDANKLPTSNALSWLYTVAKNNALLILRKKSNNINLNDAYEIEDTNNEINDLMDIESYNKLISRLNIKEKEIISLKILGNFSFKEIAELLEEPISTIKWRYYKSIHSLKLLLSSLGMFLATFGIGIKLIFNKKSSTLNDEQSLQMTNNENMNSSNQEVEDIKDANNREDSTSKFDNTEQDDTNSYFETEKDITLGNETTQYTESKTNIHSNYVGIGLLSFAGVFFIITIMFLINNIKYKIRSTKKS